MDIFDFIFPKKCLGCAKDGAYLCTSCIKKVKVARPRCVECERPSIDGMTHVKCKRELGLDAVVSIWAYEGVIRKAVLSLKYKFALEIAKEIADHSLGYLKENKLVFPKDPILIPIPLYKTRSNWRGFNQAEEIGRLIAEEMNWKFSQDLLIRKKSVKPQAELKEEERLKNIKGVFAVNSHYSSFIIHTPIILFDDVLTTGATLKEAAKILKRNGAEVIWGLTIAR